MCVRACVRVCTVYVCVSQTRLSDWREGGIGSKFMLGKLKEASKKIKEYEQSAAPGNWICEWDR